MNIFRKFLIATAIITLLFIPFAYQASATAPGPKVSELSSAGKGNKHNLSAKAWPYGTTTYPDSTNYIATDNPNTYKATYAADNPKGQQICIFCHTPHSANVEGGAPLWNRAFSTQTFSRYSAQSSWMAIRHNSTAANAAQYGQPDGSSKLCLSCHDGVASLGAVLNGGPITMTHDVISFAETGSLASFKPSTSGADKMKTGHHPVSFVYNSTVANAINSFKSTSDWKWPITVTEAKLDSNSKMQCTTCHDPHQNKSHDDQCYLSTDETQVVTCNATNNRKVAPFWVYNIGSDPVQDRDNVCEGCHAVNRAWTDPALPWN